MPFSTDLGTQAILSSKSGSGGKIKTLRKEMFQINGDGRKSSMPSRQEHVLFENNMYLCTYVFGNETGKRMTEVYLWCGDGVSSSAVEDAQLFCRNAARDAGGKLTILSQGKESSNFLEALGGIVIRHGSSASASSTFVLCGRRHMGQIAFDEVAFLPQSLCSGFPHLVAAPTGPLYLWKGHGSNADEVSCARLIGTDLGLTGEIAEVDEGREPDAFWTAFGRSSERPDAMAARWAQKAATDKYRTRLFAVDDARPKSASSFLWTRLPGTPTESGGAAAAGIREVAPYSQADLARDGLYVLDTYFELFM